MSAEPLENHFFDEQTKKNIQAWLDGPYDEQSKAEIQKLLKDHPESLKDAFFKKLDFGTGGIRAVMGIGTNRLNVYTLRMATQGLANYILQQKIQNPSVVIGYDSRNNSRKFAEETAAVFFANGIQVWLFDHVSPTPLVSFACREKKATAAVMITASHNRPQYNGYKVYWSDGAQVVTPHDKEIIAEVDAITDPSKVKTMDFSKAKVQWLKQDIYENFVQKISTLQTLPSQNEKRGSELSIIYSNLHGTGITTIPDALKSWGFSKVSFVEEQKALDGNFPNASYPNPEEKEALKFGVKHLNESHADIFIASDPDADRMGVVVNHQGKPFYLTGNQVACLCLHHLITSLKKEGKMADKPACIKTIVTTELFAAIAQKASVTCFDVLTGFKYIGEKIRQWESSNDGYHFLFGAEESYGYLVGTYSRDKDATGVSCLIAEMALNMKLQNKTLADLLFEMYATYGVYREHLESIALTDSPEGMAQKERMMKSLRENPPKKVLDTNLLSVEDYLNQTKLDLKTKTKEKLNLPKSDVLRFWFDDGSKLVIRPSGTEPKIKIYAGVFSDNKDIEKTTKFLDERLQKMIDGIQQIMHG